jgi:hypothetical protein
MTGRVLDVLPAVDGHHRRYWQKDADEQERTSAIKADTKPAPSQRTIAISRDILLNANRRCG